MFVAGLALGSHTSPLLSICRQKVDNFTRIANDIVNVTIVPVQTLRIILCCPRGCSCIFSHRANCEICNQSPLPENFFYFMPLRDKLQRLVDSDLARLLQYDRFRKPPLLNHMDDFLDSEACRNIRAMAKPNHFVIFVEVVIDGALVFNKGMAKMEPVTVSILSLPEPLRHMLHVGMFVTLLQKGGLRCAFDLMVSEFSFL